MDFSLKSRMLAVQISLLFFMLSGRGSGQIELAESLFDTEDLQGARVEALRILSKHPQHARARRLLDRIPPPASENAVDSGPRRWAIRPAFWLISFYRNQISPAIGSRCSMHPSCSAYAESAFRHYGWIGLPLTADRLVRESDHVRLQIQPIYVDGRIRYHDPVGHHTRWLRRPRHVDP